jgi:hypothetical protein
LLLAYLPAYAPHAFFLRFLESNLVISIRFTQTQYPTTHQVRGVPPTLQEVQVAQETRAPQEEEREAQHQDQDQTVLKMQGAQAQHHRVQEPQEHVQEQVQAQEAQEPVQAQETQDHERDQQQETKEQETQDQGQHQDQEQQKPGTPEVLGEKALNAR